jgi:hypothetical protein
MAMRSHQQLVSPDTRRKKMKRILVILAVAALALAGLVTAASARSSERPFKGSMEGSALFIPGTDCTTTPEGLRTDSVATGNVSHLGKTEMTSSHCTPAGPDIEGGTMVLVAANDDELYIEYTGTAREPGPDGIITVDVLYTITGGSGRFVGASGGGDMIVAVVFEGFDDFEWPASWSWTGTIDY